MKPNKQTNEKLKSLMINSKRNRLFIVRARYEVYEEQCGYQKGVTMCPESPASCRTAIKGATIFHSSKS